MRHLRKAALALIVLGTLSVQACSESPTAPATAQAPAAESLLGGLLGLDVDVVHRKVALKQDEVVTQTIGKSGGTLSLPLAGLTVTVPAGAVTTNTVFTVTAPKGNLVGYYFDPHGVVFKKPLHAVQNLAGTDLNILQKLLAPPVAAYFDGKLQPKVKALELLNLNLLGLLNQATFEIKHFSGYVIATD